MSSSSSRSTLSTLLQVLGEHSVLACPRWTCAPLRWWRYSERKKSRSTLALRHKHRTSLMYWQAQEKSLRQKTSHDENRSQGSCPDLRGPRIETNNWSVGSLGLGGGLISVPASGATGRGSYCIFGRPRSDRKQASRNESTAVNAVCPHQVLTWPG